MSQEDDLLRRLEALKNAVQLLKSPAYQLPTGIKGLLPEVATQRLYVTAEDLSAEDTVWLWEMGIQP